MISIKKLFATKKAVTVGAAVALTLGLSGAAYAFFTQSGSATGAVQDGTVSGWTITFPGYSSTPLYPGGPTQTFVWAAQNTSGGQVQLTSVTATLTTDNANEVYNTANDSWATGCYASWFSTSVDYNPGGQPNPVPANGTYTGHVTVALNDSGTNQDACIGVNPQIVVSAS